MSCGEKVNTARQFEQLGGAYISGDAKTELSQNRMQFPSYFKILCCFCVGFI